MPTKKKKPKPKAEKVYKDGLTNKQRAFIAYYIQSWNATDAAIKAGYSRLSAFTIGPENLRKPLIKQAINQHLFDLGVNAHRVLAEQVAIAFGNMGDFATIEDGGGVYYTPSSELGPKTKLIKKIKEKRTISQSPDGEEILINSSVEIQLYDKQKALEVLGRVTEIVKEREPEPENSQLNALMRVLDV